MSLQSLDSKGRCCGRKPIEYKRYGGHHFFCTRCDREYDPATKKQRANWAYDEDGNRITRQTRSIDYACSQAQAANEEDFD